MSGHLSMGSVLKNNRNLLRSKKPYLNDVRKKQLKAIKGELEFKTFSKEKQKLFIENFKKKKKQEIEKYFF